MNINKTIFAALMLPVAALTACSGGGGSSPANDSGNLTSPDNLSALVNVSIAPDQVDFGAVQSGNISSLVVTITNKGTDAISGFADGIPDDEHFSITTDCVNLLPGNKCNFTYNFAPDVNGAYQAMSHITTHSGYIDILLTGTSMGSALWVTPQGLEFGEVGVGETSPVQTVTITNQGTTTLTDFTGAIPADSPFRSANNCSGGLAPGNSCQYQFTYTPVNTNASEMVSNYSTSAGSFSVKLAGKGYVGNFVVSPLSLDIGRVVVGTESAPQTLRFKNVGNTKLQILQTNFPAGVSYAKMPACPKFLVPGEGCEITYWLIPRQEGAVTFTLEGSTSAGPFTVSFTGTGVTSTDPVAGPKLMVSATSLDFGPVGMGATSDPQLVTLTNIGDATLSIGPSAVPINSPFKSTQDCSSSIAAGASCQFTFTYTPTAPGAVKSTLYLSTSGGKAAISLAASGAGAKAWVTPTILDFGNVRVGTTSVYQAVTVTNTGRATLINFAGGAPWDTQFQASQNCASGVAPGASCTYWFTFTPVAAGFAESSSNSTTTGGDINILVQGSALGP